MNHLLSSLPTRRLAGVSMALLALVGCDSSEQKNSYAELSQLNIERSVENDRGRDIGEIQRARNWESRAAAGQPFLVSYRLPLKLADSWSVTSPAAFAAPQEDSGLFILQEILQQSGVDFKDSTWALYDPQTEIAFAYQTDGQHKMIEEFFDAANLTSENGHHLNFEVLEVAADEANAILQIATDSERYAVLQSWLPSGRAHLVGVSSTPASSGQRSTSETVIEVSTTDPTIVEDDSSKEVGLLVEFDPVRSSDNQTLDLRAQLSTTELKTASAPAHRKEKLLMLPPPASFITELSLPFDEFRLLGLLTPPSDIALTKPVPGSPDDSVLFAFVRASDYDVRPSQERNSPPDSASDIGNPFQSRTHIYRISQTQWKALGVHLFGYGGGPPAFSNPELLELLPNNSSRTSLTSILAKFGFKFRASDQLVYHSESETLIASLDAFEMTRLELLFRHFLGGGTERNITLQLEIFELPARHCSDLAHSAARGADHTPEWHAVQQLVDGGSADVVTCLMTTSRHDSRTKVESFSDRIFVRDYAPPVSKDPKSEDGKSEAKSPTNSIRRSPNPHPQFETYEIGTTLETESLFHHDGFALNVGVSLKHHTAPPEAITRTLQYPEHKGGRTAEISVPVFHRHQTHTYTNMAIDSTRILAVWRPTGLPRYSDEDLMQIAFLRATASPAYKIERIR